MDIFMNKPIAVKKDIETALAISMNLMGQNLPDFAEHFQITASID